MFSLRPGTLERLLVWLLPRPLVADVDALHLRQVCAICRLEGRDPMLAFF